MTRTSGRSPLLRDQRFVLLASARTISVLGNGFARVALAFAVLALPGSSPGKLSLVLACQSLPQLLFILAGGVIADRMSRSRLMVVADAVGALAYAGLAAMALSGHAPWALMCVLAVAAGLATALFTPAMDGVVPLVVPADRLQQANGLLRMSTNTCLFLGLALSGVIVAWIGAGWALALNAVSFVVSAVLTGRLRLPARPARTSSLWADLREGWREFASRQWLWVVVAQCTAVVAVFSATLGVLGPLEAQRHLGGARSWSVIVAAQALGAIAGAGLAVRVRAGRPVLVAVIATFPAALPMVFLSLSAPVWLIAASMFCAGVASDVFNVLWVSTLQREIPEQVLSRVSSYDALGSLAFAPLGLLAAGPVAQGVGSGTALAGCATVVVLATLAAVVSPQVRALPCTASPLPGSTAGGGGQRSEEAGLADSGPVTRPVPPGPGAR
ncbi:MFS transporter [Streptomyces sp. NPDC029080]|uniref:MFS transporter n=1 Tax=Streptomyces sp. NPDC029080 TaxID=3155017 RepID=UPI0033C3862D